MRVEDALVLGLGLILLGFAGTRSALSNVSLSENDYGALCIFLAPASLLIFAGALRFAVHGAGSLREGLGPLGGVVRDWSPFLVFLVLYSIFANAVWYKLMPLTRDATLLAIDRAVLGETPAVTLQAIVTPWLADLLAGAYFMHLVLPPVIAIFWYRRDRVTFREFLLAVLGSAALASIGYGLVPAVGPWVAFPDLFSGPLRGVLIAEPVATFMDLARAPRDAFPSLHVGLSAVVLFYARRLGRPVFLVFLPFVVVNWLATILLRYHYMIDVVAGFVLAAVAIVLARYLLRVEGTVKGQISGVHTSAACKREPCESCPVGGHSDDDELHC